MLKKMTNGILGLPGNIDVYPIARMSSRQIFSIQNDQRPSETVPLIEDKAILKSVEV